MLHWIDTPSGLQAQPSGIYAVSLHLEPLHGASTGPQMILDEGTMLEWDDGVKCFNGLFSCGANMV